MLIIAKLKTSCSQNSAIIQYKLDTGSEGSIMPYHIFKTMFPRGTTQQLVATKQEHHSENL